MFSPLSAFCHTSITLMAESRADHIKAFLGDRRRYPFEFTRSEYYHNVGVAIQVANMCDSPLEQIRSFFKSAECPGDNAEASVYDVGSCAQRLVLYVNHDSKVGRHILYRKSGA